MRYILHIDLNSFFATVEELQNPSYCNKPLVVGGLTKRSVVASANYLARSYGIRAAMPIYMVHKLCKNVIITTPHFHLYREYSERFINLISEHITNQIEIVSIDECYIDITNFIQNKITPEQIARKIQMLIKKKIGLNCSVGIAHNKFLAKMASDFKKPMGISTLYPNEIPNKLWPLPIEEMLWIGKSTSALLKQNNVYTIGDVAKKENRELLKTLLDKNWEAHYYHANGIGDDEIDLSQNMPKSIGASETFLIDTNNISEVEEKLKSLTNDVVDRLHHFTQITKTISVNIKTPDFKSHNRSITLTNYTDDFDVVWQTVTHIYQHSFENQTIRLIGVSLNKLKEKKEIQVTSELFDDYKHSFNEKLVRDTDAILIEEINHKFTKNIIGIAKDKLK